jgi:hypothetical protein
MTVPRLVLVPSPLLGPSVWEPVSAVLGADGWDVSVVPRPATAPRDADDVLAHLLDHVPADRSVVLVPHSNAGLYVPAVAGVRDVVASAFVDAALPPPSGPAPLAPAELLTVLERLVDSGGLLPPWTAWWGEEQVRPLFGHHAHADAVRAAVEADQHRLPLEYFRGRVGSPAGWPGGWTTAPAAYLAFGDTYATERDQAAGWGWPVRTLRGGHLHQLVDPRAVADAVVGLLGVLGVGGVAGPAQVTARPASGS